MAEPVNADCARCGAPALEDWLMDCGPYTGKPICDDCWDIETDAILAKYPERC